jgi:hypothetical protein
VVRILPFTNNEIDPNPLPAHLKVNYALNTLQLVKCFAYGDVTADPECSNGTIPYQINDRVGILFTLQDGTNT